MKKELIQRTYEEELVCVMGLFRLRTLKENPAFLDEKGGVVGFLKGFRKKKS